MSDRMKGNSEYIEDAEDFVPLIEKSQVSVIENDTLQYEPEESEIWKHEQVQMSKYSWFFCGSNIDQQSWILTLITGIFCGIMAIAVSIVTKTLSSYKFYLVHSFVEKEKINETPFGTAFGILLLCNVLFSVLAWLMVYLQPLARGSGIPELKSFLNGINIPEVVSCKTLVCKTVGIIFSCASGLALGKEGPMVHAGAIIAALVSQGRIICKDSYYSFKNFRNDKQIRDFVACGAASGVASAFGAPVGGVLFALEEGASFWSTKLTWRCFFCAMTTLFALFFFKTANQLFGHSKNGALFSFGEFFSLNGETSNYSVWELPLFVFVGCAGGVIGAIFNSAVQISTCARIQFKICNSSLSQLLSVILLTMFTTVISFFLPYILNQCTPVPEQSQIWRSQERDLALQLVPLYCPTSHYNELASLYLVDADTAIKQLFHFRELGDANDSTFSSSTLFVFFITYIILACFTTVAAIPSGLFVPSLLSGAAFGRLLGHILHRLDSSRGTFADSGTFALMGAAAISGGIARMTISLTVMILEGTGDMQYVVPLMLVVMAARFVGNIFNEGIYDMNIRMLKVEYLDEDIEEFNIKFISRLMACDIMTKTPVYLHEVVNVGELVTLLKSCNHRSFPIVTKDEKLCGTISRKTLCSLLKLRAFPLTSNVLKSNIRSLAGRFFDNFDNRDTDYYSNGIEMTSFDESNNKIIKWDAIERFYPDYPDISDCSIAPVERHFTLELHPYIDFGPYTIRDSTTVQRTYRLFRTLGLRLLCVVDIENKLVGVITRENLSKKHIISCQRPSLR